MTKRTKSILERLDERYTTEFRCSLNYTTPWELLAATMLSAQCTDERVNIVTKDLFVKYPDVSAVAHADVKEMEQDIRSIGFYHSKAKNLIETARRICVDFGGEVPSSLEELTSLPGVGRKTANVIRGNIFHEPSIVVDTHVKRISQRLGFTKETEPEKIEYVIANCAECEPYITADYRRMMENPEDLVEGMRVILKLFDNAKGIFAVEDNKPDCIEKLEKLTSGEPRMEVAKLMTKYPQGGERQLIYAVTKRAINSSMLPADVGCVVDNVETIIHIYDAVVNGRPCIDRVVTVSGDGIMNPGNFKVPLGMNQQELVNVAGGFQGTPEKIVSGGPMMGFAMFTLDVPVTKTSSSILCMTKDEVAKYEPSACINCGRCIEACPSRLIPSRLADYAERHDEAAFEKEFGVECMECGSCSYVCPAKRQLKQAISSMRKTVLANRKKK